MSPYRTPAYRPPSAAPAAPADAAQPAPAAQTTAAPALGPQAALPGGIGLDPPAPGGRAYGRAEVTQSAQPSADDRSRLRRIEVEASGIDAALTEFIRLRRGASGGTMAASAAGLPTALSTSYTNAALLSKGEALYNLGVLNGPDLSIIRRALADPATIRGGLASQESVEAQAEQIRTLLNQRLATSRQQYGGQAPPAAPAAPAANGTAPASGEGWSIRPATR